MHWPVQQLFIGTQTMTPIQKGIVIGFIKKL